MVGVHPSMPDTLDGDGILAQAEMRGGGECVDPRNDHKNTRRVGAREGNG